MGREECGDGDSLEAAALPELRVGLGAKGTGQPRSESPGVLVPLGITEILLGVLLPPDPVDWSPGNVQKWILWTEHQYRLPQIGKSFQELSGKDLCAMSEEQFCQRSPACGDILHAHLDIWKSGGCWGPAGGRCWK